MDDFLTVFGTASFFGTGQIVSSLLLSFVLCSVFAAIYRWTFQGLSYSRAFVHALVLGGMIVCMIIMAIGNNLARGLGILGTLAIVRFRTPIRDARDMMFLFGSLGVGISCGAMTYNVAIIGTLVLSGATLYLHWSPFASRREFEGLLRFTLAAHSGSSGDVQAVLRASCSDFDMIAMREAIQGDAMEYSYHVRLIDPSYRSEMVEKLRDIKDVQDASLLMQRTTVEL